MEMIQDNDDSVILKCKCGKQFESTAQGDNCYWDEDNRRNISQCPACYRINGHKIVSLSSLRDMYSDAETLFNNGYASDAAELLMRRIRGLIGE